MDFLHTASDVRSVPKSMWVPVFLVLSFAVSSISALPPTVLPDEVNQEMIEAGKSGDNGQWRCLLQTHTEKALKSQQTPRFSSKASQGMFKEPENKQDEPDNVHESKTLLTEGNPANVDAGLVELAAKESAAVITTRASFAVMSIVAVCAVAGAFVIFRSKEPSHMPFQGVAPQGTATRTLANARASPAVPLQAISKNASPSLLAVSTGSEDKDKHHVMKKKLIKMDINLLLQEAWQLDAQKAGDHEKLCHILTKVVGLIKDAYGHSDSFAGTSGKRTLSVDDYVDLANDYFDVQEETARKMFQRSDLDHSGSITFDELEQLLKPLFEEHAALQQLYDNGVKASNADRVLLFATTSKLSDGGIRMAYLALDLGIFVKGNFALMCITTLLFLNYFSSFMDASMLGLYLYIAQSVIYLVYCVVFWRYFGEDWWTTAGLWLYTAGYLVFTYYYYQMVTKTASILSPTQVSIAGFLLFSVGSIPFFLALVPSDSGTTSDSVVSKMLSMRFKYDHTNTSARGGLLFLAGSILFLLTYRPGIYSAEQTTILVSTAYALYVWGRVEFFFGIVFSARETAEKLAAAATWQRLTTGVEVRNPNCVERFIHLLWGTL